MPPEGTTDIFVISNQKSDINGNNDQDQNQNVVTFEDALKIIGFGKLHIIILIVSALVILTVLNETMGISIIMPSAECDLSLTPTRKGLLSAISFVGIFLTAQLWGYLADTRGRRKIIQYTLYGSLICTLVSSFAHEFWLFVILRFAAGVFVSGYSGTIYAYLGEFNVNVNRPAVIGYASIAVAISSIYTPLFGLLFLPQDWSLTISDSLHYRPWRLLLIIYALPGAIAALILLFLPESPKYLLSQGHDDEALQGLKWIYKFNKNKELDDFPLKSLVSEIDKEHYDNIHGRKGVFAVLKLLINQTIPLFQRPHAKNFINCCFIIFGVFFTASGIGLWFPDIQNKIRSTDGMNSQTLCNLFDASISQYNQSAEDYYNNENCDDSVNVKALDDTLILGGFYLVAFVLYSLVIKYVGRGIVMGVSLFISAICGYFLQFITNTIAMLIFFSLHIVSCGINISVVTGTVVDIIPTHLRGMGVCVCFMFGRLGSIVGTNVVGVLLELNCTANFYVFASLILACAISSCFIPRR